MVDILTAGAWSDPTDAENGPQFGQYGESLVRRRAGYGRSTTKIRSANSSVTNQVGRFGNKRFDCLNGALERPCYPFGAHAAAPSGCSDSGLLQALQIGHNVFAQLKLLELHLHFALGSFLVEKIRQVLRGILQIGDQHVRVPFQALLAGFHVTG